jgi:hypothetical protein
MAKTAQVIGIVVNRVKRARDIYERLHMEIGDKSDVVLLIVRTRDIDRDNVLTDLLPRRRGSLQYDTTRAAVAGLTRALAADHSSEGIRVNAVGPGPIFTPFHARRIAAAGETVE